MNEWQVVTFLTQCGVSFLLTQGKDARFFLHTHSLPSNKSHYKPYYRFCEIPVESSDPPIYWGSVPLLFGFLKILLELTLIPLGLSFRMGSQRFILMKCATFMHWNNRKFSCAGFLCFFVYRFSSWLFLSCISSLIKHLVSLNFICTYECISAHAYIHIVCVYMYRCICLQFFCQLFFFFNSLNREKEGSIFTLVTCLIELISLSNREEGQTKIIFMPYPPAVHDSSTYMVHLLVFHERLSRKYH